MRTHHAHTLIPLYSKPAASAARGTELDRALLAIVTGAGPTANVVADNHSLAVSHQDQTFKFKNETELHLHLIDAVGRRDREQTANALYAIAGLKGKTVNEAELAKRLAKL